MPEPLAESADTRIPPFPWVAVGAVAVTALLLGACLGVGFASWPTLRSTTILKGIVASGVSLVLAVRALRTAVRDWRRTVRRNVEYDARRQRERESGLRFLGP